MAASIGPIRRFLVLSLVAIGPMALASCSSDSSAQQASDGPISVQTSQLFVTVENRAGLALMQVEVAILPVGRSTEFTRFVGRLESNQKRDVSVAEFRGRDGTPFNLRVIKPRTVRVRAKDIHNKPYEVAVPWS